MGFTVHLCIFLSVLIGGTATKSCSKGLLLGMPFVVEYAVWRGWHQVIFYTPYIDKDCYPALVRLSKCLSVNGVGSAWNVTKEPRLMKNLALVIFTPPINNSTTQNITKLLKQLNNQEMNTASFDWLVMANSQRDFRNMNTILNTSDIRFDQNIVVAYPHYQKHSRPTNVCEKNFVYKSDNSVEQRRGRKGPYCQNCFKTNHQKSYFRTSERFQNITRNKSLKSSGRIFPLYLSGQINYNYSKPFDMLNISSFSLRWQFQLWRIRYQVDRIYDGVHIIQYFKVRVNSTLYAWYLGNWEKDNSMSLISIPYTTEARNFLGEELVAGRCNHSTDEGEDTALADSGPSAPELLDDVLFFISVQLNATSMNRYYGKLGFRTYEGSWTGLLGGLMDQSVDIALEPVTALAPSDRYMDFIFPIAETMCNIYIRQQETSTVRDIFLAPFSARLLGCVISVVVIASLTIVLISKLAPAPELGNGRPMGYVEALLWITGILCQQGGSWTPPNSAASVLLIVCLLFAVVTYNAYAAFITSVLSVRVASVDTIAAVLNSPDFKIGYIRNGADQMYLMSTKDVQLNAFYIRGYSDAENLVTTAEEGLARAAKQDYAFFAGQRAARTSLRSLSQARGRCSLRELSVPSTRAQLAFPLPLRSPYARPTLVSLLQLRESGTLDRLERALVPDMPQCARPQGFASARAADVRSALLLLLIGLISAFVLGIAEYSWKNKRELNRFVARVYRRIVIFVTHLF